MAKDKKTTAPAPEAEEAEQEAPAEAPEQSAAEPDAETAAPDQAQQLQAQLDEAKAAQAAAEDRLLRLAAEYDNFRKRTAKEKEGIWSDAKASVVTALLPVYDNLERALKQETADAAYKKGVEMTMTGLKDVFARLEIEEIPALGETFDPNFHNAVMHVDDEAAEENTVVEVFQTGFKLGEKVLRFAMVKVAN